MAGSGQELYGKFRGVVLNNLDPFQRGRLQVQVPDATGSEAASWAEPCLPIGGLHRGIFEPPEIGSGVWIEFERGDPDYPIWVGQMWEIGGRPGGNSFRAVEAGSPEWTGHADADPGVSLAELSAYVAESLLYRRRAGESDLATDGEGLRGLLASVSDQVGILHKNLKHLDGHLLVEAAETRTGSRLPGKLEAPDMDATGNDAVIVPIELGGEEDGPPDD